MFKTGVSGRIKLRRYNCKLGLLGIINNKYRMICSKTVAVMDLYVKKLFSTCTWWYADSSVCKRTQLSKCYSITIIIVAVVDVTVNTKLMFYYTEVTHSGIYVHMHL